ncbi:MAG: DUF1566 domain-containing protein [Gammaproteobacteria bacterium]|nr:DUF1566 domain-containing protein [Gammaproteobacteria bacterium]
MKLVPRIILFSAIIFSDCLYAQTCGVDAPALSSDTRFFINEDNTITDLESGLTWMRCSVGMVWDGKICIGSPRLMDWAQAKHWGQTMKLGAYTWRLPQLSELATLVERECRHSAAPRINHRYFPNTPLSPFWTANATPGRENHYYVLGFDARGVGSYLMDLKFALRLVAGREN